MILNEIVKKQHKWVAYAFSLSKDKELANDIVQDMYLKVFKIDKQVDNSYIYKVIRNIFFDIKSKKKEFSVDVSYFDYLEEEGVFEIDDKGKKLLNKFENLEEYHKFLIVEKDQKSLRQIAKELGVNYGHIYREIKKAREKLFKNIKTNEKSLNGISK